MKPLLFKAQIAIIEKSPLSYSPQKKRLDFAQQWIAELVKPLEVIPEYSSRLIHLTDEDEARGFEIVEHTITVDVQLSAPKSYHHLALLLEGISGILNSLDCFDRCTLSFLD